MLGGEYEDGEETKSDFLMQFCLLLINYPLKIGKK